MAVILDPTTAVGAKVSAAGAMHITAGGDGFPTYVTRLGSGQLLTAVPAAGNFLFAMRAPSTRTIDIRYAALRFTFVGTAVATSVTILEWVRFSAADPTGGQAIVPVRKNTAEASPQTVAIREYVVGTLVTSGAGATVGTATEGFGSVVLWNGASGGSVYMEYPDFNGMLLAPGEGVGLRYVTAGIAGQSLSGFMEFSERT